MPTYTSASAYLRRFDIPSDKDIELTIRAFEKRDMKARNRGRVRRYVLYFVERAECLALNKPNGEAICKLYGKEMRRWIGKRIILFRDPTVQMYGQRVAGIRVRA